MTFTLSLVLQYEFSLGTFIFVLSSSTVFPPLSYTILADKSEAAPILELTNARDINKTIRSSTFILGHYKNIYKR